MSYRNKTLWVNINNKEIEELEEHHNVDVFLEPDKYGIRASAPELKKYKKKHAKAERNDDVDERNDIEFNIQGDPDIHRLMFEKRWIRANWVEKSLSGKDKDLSIHGPDLKSVHLAAIILVNEYAPDSINIDIGHYDDTGYSIGGELKGDDIEFFIKTGRIPRNLIQSFNLEGPISLDNDLDDNLPISPGF